MLYGVVRACGIGSSCARALDAYMNGALKIVYHQANKKDAPELAIAISPEARPSGFSSRTPTLGDLLWYLSRRFIYKYFSSYRR